MRDNVVTTLIHRLKSPAYGVLLGSVVLRGLIGVLTAVTVPYSQWPSFLQLAINLCVFFGVVICGEILFGAAVASRARYARELRDVSEEETPLFRGKPEIITQQIAAWNKRLDRRLRNVKREIHTETMMVLTGGVISNLYAVNFFVQATVHDARVLSAFDIAIEISSIITASVVIYYFSARLKEERPDIAGQSEDIVVHGVSSRLSTAADRAKAGQETDQDIELMSRTLPKGHMMQRLLPALRKNPDKLLTSADIFELLGIDDASTQRGVRRALYRAGSEGLHGVYKDASDNAWRLPAGQLHAFIEYANLSGDKARTKRGATAREILQTAATDTDAARARRGAGQDTERPAEPVAAQVSAVDQPPPIAQMWAMGYAE